MNLVHHQQAACQRTGTEQGMLDGQNAEKRLIDRADRNAGGKEVLGALRRPAMIVDATGLAIVPAHLVAGQLLPLRVAGHKIAGDGENRLRRPLAPDAFQHVVHALLKLDGRCTRGKREIQAVHLAATAQFQPAP